MFGDDGGGGQVPDATLVVAARMPGLRVRSLVHLRKDLVTAGRMPAALQCACALQHRHAPARGGRGGRHRPAGAACDRGLDLRLAGHGCTACGLGVDGTGRQALAGAIRHCLAGRAAARGGYPGVVSAGAGAAWCRNAGPLARGSGRARGSAGHGPGCRASAGRLGSTVSGNTARPSPHGRSNGPGCDGPAIPIHHGRRPISAAVPGISGALSAGHEAARWQVADQAARA